MFVKCVHTTGIIIPYIIFYYIKIIRQFGCFTENLLMWETNIYNAVGNNRLLPGLQALTRGSGLKILVFFSPVRNCIFYAGNYFVVLGWTKHSSHKHLDKTEIAFIWGEHQVVNPWEVVFLSASGWQLSMFTSCEGNNCLSYTYR